MELKDIDTILNKLNQVQRTFGIVGAIIFILLIFGSFLGWKYFIKRIESVADESSEKSLKKFQSQLDIEFVKFQTKHQIQVDAIHETFQKFQKLTGIINFIMKGDKYTKPINPQDEVKYLIQFRNDFKKVYNQNRLLFPEQLCTNIELLIPSVDEFIDTYVNGLIPETSEEENEQNSEDDNEISIAGVWSQNEFDVLEKLDQISKDIETEFRKIYGTHE